MNPSMKISPAVEKKIIRETEKVFGRGFHVGEDFRQRIYETAFHEAAHSVARMFTGHEASHVQFVTIIPDNETVGKERSSRHTGLSMLAAYPDYLRQCPVRCLLLCMLAGRAAEHRVASEETREDILDFDSEEWDLPGADLYRANELSLMLARPHMPQNRILKLAEKWTVEMMEIPQVWLATENLAAALLKTGTVDGDGIFELCENVLDLSMRLSVWRKRIHALPVIK